MSARGIFFAGMLGVLVTGIAAAPAQAEGSAARESAAQAPLLPDRVIACYFHRTQRCATCRRIGDSIDEALRGKFSEELKSGRLQWTLVDFQAKKNARYAEYYRITGPTLVFMLVRDGKVVAWKKADRVWTLLADQERFFDYIHQEAEAYLAAEIRQDRPQAVSPRGASR